MPQKKILTDNPVSVGLLAASTVCIVLLGIYLVTSLLNDSFDPVVWARVLAAMAAVFAAVAIAISDFDAVAGDNR